jgi:glycosyltransferase involved in cell wall biosynthesis
LVDALYVQMERWGYPATVYRSRFAAGDVSFRQRLALALRYWQPQPIEERGLRTVIVPAPPVPLWLFYLVPQFLVGTLLGAYPCVFVVSGSAHVALPLALRGMPYVLWIATLYEDELRGKADAGDAWAKRVLHSPFWPVLRKQEEWALRSASRILALSSHTAQRIRDSLPDVAERVETVLYPVDLSRFHPNPEARSRSPYGRYLLLAARINDPRKNAPLLLRAFALVLKQHPALRLILVGDDPDESLLSLVRQLSLEDAVIFRGIVSEAELLELYQAAQLFVLPSAQEGLGIVVLEAMACGTPVVTLASGGPEGVVIDGVTGRVVREGNDPAALAQAILGLLADPAQRDAMRENCVTEARKHFSADVISGRLRAAYESSRSAPPRLSRVSEVVLAGWTIFVLFAYIQRQIALHGASIQERIIKPLISLLQ